MSDTVRVLDRSRLSRPWPSVDGELERHDTFDCLCDAMAHLLEARAWERAIELLRRRSALVDAHGRWDAFSAWLEAVPTRHWQNDIEMMLLDSWANLRRGRTSGALARMHDPIIIREPLAVATAKVQYACAVAWTTDPREAIAIASATRSTFGEPRSNRWYHDVPGVHDPMLAADVAVAQAYALLGRFELADQGFEQMRCRRADLSVEMQSQLCHTHAFVLALQGRTRASVETAREGDRLARDTVPEDVRCAWSGIAAAAIAALRGEQLVAMEHLADAVSASRRAGASNLLRICEFVAAVAGIAAEYVGDTDPNPAALPLVRKYVGAEHARRRVRLGDLDGAVNALRAITPHELTLSAWVEVLLATQDRSAVERWLRSQPAPTSQHAQIVRALAEAAVAGRRDRVADLAAGAARLAEPERSLGVLLNAPGQLWERPGVTHSGHPLLLEVVERLDENDDPPTMLTQRELDLLRLLPRSLSVESLAGHLFVSVSTVKWHRANLYRKLGANSRQAAIDAAIDRGLLENVQTGDHR